MSRANLLHGLVAKDAAPAVASDDAGIWEQVIASIKAARITEPYVNVVVAGGIVHLWGFVGSEAQKDATRIAAETAPGGRTVQNNVAVGVYPALRSGWA